MGGGKGTPGGTKDGIGQVEGQTQCETEAKWKSVSGRFRQDSDTDRWANPY